MKINAKEFDGIKLVKHLKITPHEQITFTIIIFEEFNSNRELKEKKRRYTNGYLISFAFATTNRFFEQFLHSSRCSCCRLYII